MVTCSSYDLRTAVAFQRNTQTRDAYGELTDSWATIAAAPTRCAFKALSGTERLVASRMDAQTRVRIVVRYFAGLTEADRAVIAGQNYRITFLNNVRNEGRWLEIDLAGGLPT